MEREYVLTKIDLAVKDLTDVDEMEENDRLPYLKNFLSNLEKNETWQAIDKKCREWDGDGLC